MSLRIGIAGPPHSGKSVFVTAILEALDVGHTDSKRFWHYADTDPIDKTGPNLHRRENQPKADVIFDDELAREIAEKLRSDRLESLIITDLPGKLTSQLEIIMEPLDGIILLDPGHTEIAEYEALASSLNCTVLLLIETHKLNTRRRSRFERIHRKATLVGLERKLMRRGGISNLRDDTALTIHLIADWLAEISRREP